MHNTIFVICGSTSTGKTSLALDLCLKFNGEIISADSRQIYKYMDIGTGKMPVNAENELTLGEPVLKSDGRWSFNGVNFWGYDLVEPGSYFSSYDFAFYARTKAFQLLSKGKNVFIVGGTGFYIDAFTGDLSLSRIKPDFELRRELESYSKEELLLQLQKTNMDSAKKIDASNKLRLIRALEREKLQNNSKKDKPLPNLKDVKFIFIGLTAQRSVLFSRADLWLEATWQNGLLSEVKNLVSRGYGNSPQMQSILYKQVMSFLNSEILEEKAKELCKFALHDYIRRQQTWFKRNKNIQWFDINDVKFKKDIFDFFAKFTF